MFAVQIPPYAVEDWISFLVVGVLAAFLVGYLMRRRGFGLIGNLIIGVVGALIGAFGLGFIPDQYDYLDKLPEVALGDVAKAMVGALFLLVVLGFLKKKR